MRLASAAGNRSDHGGMAVAGAPDRALRCRHRA